MKRFLCLLLVIALLLPAAALADTEDYTVAGKLFKQLWAGSGFSGTLTLNSQTKQGDGLWQKPAVVNVDYIYVRPTDTAPARHRADLTLMDGDSALTAAHLHLEEGTLYAQADIIGPDWYGLTDVENSAPAVQDTVNGWLNQTGAPQLAALALGALSAVEETEGLDTVEEKYATRIDLWFEGFRQDAVLGKTEDGTSTIQVSYEVPALAVKAQIKQMLLELLSDGESLSVLTAALGQETARRYLNPELQSYYFQAVDDLPLSGSLTLSRTMSLKNELLSLYLSLPLYDAKGRTVTLSYERNKGEGDLPDENLLLLETELRAMELRYQEYRSMTDVAVVQGTFLNQPANEEEKALSLSFTLRTQETEGTDDQQRETCDIAITLNLSQNGEGDGMVEIPETEITLNAHFASKALKSAATEVQAQLTIGGDGWDSVLAAAFEGASRKKWEPEPLTEGVLLLSELTDEDMTTLLPTAAARMAALLAQYAPAQTEGDPAPESEAAPEAEAQPTAESEAESAAASAAPEAEAAPAPAGE